MRFQLTAAVSAFLFVAISGTSLPLPTPDYDGCPPHTMEWCETDKPQSCTWSTMCGTGKKCCPTSCNGRQCMNVAKPGQCMATIQGCPSDSKPDPIDCNHDYMCKGELKCCSTPCSGRTCQAPDYTVVDPVPNPEPKPKPQPETVVERPGDCKPVNWAAISCPVYSEEDAKAQCVTDADCADTRAKCCDNPCSAKRCRLPAACPYYDPAVTCVMQNPAECTVGTKCSNGRMCCAYECGGARCEPELCRGHNPDLRFIMVGPKQCQTNGACGTDNMCCSDESGGTSCVPRDYPLRAGTCPSYAGEKPVCIAVVPTNECEQDGNCDLGMKCCAKKCGGLACMPIDKPAPEVREGTCPNNVGSSEYCATVVPTSECEQDGQCEPGRKCCKKPCGGLGCMPIVKVYPPTGASVCPLYDAKADCTTKRPAYQCNPTDKCSNGGQCCTKECGGTSCETGLCAAPDRNIYCFAPEKRECESSATCASGLVCCDIYCGGSRCVAPNAPAVAPAPGPVDGAKPSDTQAVRGGAAPICPKPTMKAPCPASVRSKTCKTDGECGGKKCCETGCGLSMCQTPVRPGTCPSPNPGVRCRSPTEAEKKNKCGTDMSCPGSQKCCRPQCPGFGASCVDAEAIEATVKSGTCPMSIQGCPAGQTISNLCTDDDSCTGTLKCCSTGCGLRCTAAGV